jgi:hypothetical protein
MRYNTSPELLDRAYCQWCLWQGRSRVRLFTTSYKHIHRLGETAQQFEAWLFEQGGKVVQENKRRYIVFDNLEHYTAFLLTNV